MAARLGNVLYWFCCLVAIGVVALGAYFVLDALHSKQPTDLYTPMIPTSVVAIASFLIGRALRYILAGR